MQQIILDTEHVQSCLYICEFTNNNISLSIRLSQSVYKCVSMKLSGVITRPICIFLWIKSGFGFCHRKTILLCHIVKSSSTTCLYIIVANPIDSRPHVPMLLPTVNISVMVKVQRLLHVLINQIIMKGQQSNKCASLQIFNKNMFKNINKQTYMLLSLYRFIDTPLPLVHSPQSRNV